MLHWFQLVSAKYLNNSKPANSLQFGSPVWVVVEWSDSLNAGIWDWVFRLAIGCVSGLRRSSLMFILRGSITVYYSSDTFCNLDFFTVKNRWIYFRRWSDILRDWFLHCWNLDGEVEMLICLSSVCLWSEHTDSCHIAVLIHSTWSHQCTFLGYKLKVILSYNS